MSAEIWGRWAHLLDPENIFAVLRALLLLVSGWLLARLARRVMTRMLQGRLDPQQFFLYRRLVYYGVLMLFVVTAFHQLGFNLGVLLGAAGVLSVALGFASQTSASNVISGFFIVAERPFGVGDVIQLGSTTGEVLSIDLLSVKLRTFDNRFVRIPNETVIKSEVTTFTRFPIRRLDLAIGVAYKEDLDRVRGILFDVAHRNPLCLEEPAPLFIFQGFGASSLDIQFSPWVARENFIELKNSIQQEIKVAFDAAGIEIPFPHVSLYSGSATAPMPVRLVGPGGNAPPVGGRGPDDAPPPAPTDGA